MLTKWSFNERKYEHSKPEAKSAGKRLRDADKMLTRTANPSRTEGHPGKASAARSQPNKNLASITSAELYSRALQFKINVGSSMADDELARAIGRR
jgi:hypothetical protein